MLRAKKSKRKSSHNTLLPIKRPQDWDVARGNSRKPNLLRPPPRLPYNGNAIARCRHFYTCQSNNSSTRNFRYCITCKQHVVICHCNKPNTPYQRSRQSWFSYSPIHHRKIWSNDYVDLAKPMYSDSVTDKPDHKFSIADGQLIMSPKILLRKLQHLILELMRLSFFLAIIYWNTQ